MAQFVSVWWRDEIGKSVCQCVCVDEIGKKFINVGGGGGG